jgi:hypothetical protein
MWPIPWSAGPYRDIGIKRNKRSELAYYSSPIRLGSAFAFKFDAIHVEKPFTAILQTRRRLRREGDIGATPLNSYAEVFIIRMPQGDTLLFLPEQAPCQYTSHKWYLLRDKACQEQC